MYTIKQGTSGLITRDVPIYQFVKHSNSNTAVFRGHCKHVTTLLPSLAVFFWISTMECLNTSQIEAERDQKARPLVCLAQATLHFMWPKQEETPCIKIAHIMFLLTGQLQLWYLLKVMCRWCADRRLVLVTCKPNITVPQQLLICSNVLLFNY